MKAWLSQKQVPFVVRQVDEDDRAYDELLALGYRSVPVTAIGPTRIVGFDERALEEALSLSR